MKTPNAKPPGWGVGVLQRGIDRMNLRWPGGVDCRVSKSTGWGGLGGRACFNIHQAMGPVHGLRSECVC